MKSREGFNRPERMCTGGSLSAVSAGLAGASSVKGRGCLLSVCVWRGGRHELLPVSGEWPTCV